MTKRMSVARLRTLWAGGGEVALFDVREEDPYAEAHPLFAVSLPVSEVEARIRALVPRRSAPVAVYDAGEGHAERAARRIAAMGYSDVSVLDGGLHAYAAAGEVYRDVNVPSKAFGELVEAIRHTPSLPAPEVRRILETEKDVVVLDARRFEEYATMSIPRGRSVPGGELVYRIGEVAPSPDTLVIVNCAGRTRSIIGTQSLIDAGIPNRVVALRNGTIGWTLEGLELDRAQAETVPDPGPEARAAARARAARRAAHVGVPIIGADTLAQYRDEAGERTLYLLDVRSPQEYAAGHPAGFDSAPGGQLVQAADEWLAVRGARVVLFDSDGVRARMTGAWLYQMGWDVAVLDEGALVGDDTTPPPGPVMPDIPGAARITPAELHAAGDGVAVADLARSPAYLRGHIPGAWHVSGPELARDLARLPGTGPVVLTSPDGIVAAANLADAGSARPVRVLTGGTDAWCAAGLPLSTEPRWTSEPIDTYKRPYEGTDNPREAMQGYIDWELQLVAQLANDGISRFRVVRAAPD